MSTSISSASGIFSVYSSSGELLDRLNDCAISLLLVDVNNPSASTLKLVNSIKKSKLKPSKFIYNINVYDGKILISSTDMNDNCHIIFSNKTHTISWNGIYGDEDCVFEFIFEDSTKEHDFRLSINKSQIELLTGKTFAEFIKSADDEAYVLCENDAYDNIIDDGLNEKDKMDFVYVPNNNSNRFSSSKPLNIEPTIDEEEEFESYRPVYQSRVSDINPLKERNSLLASAITMDRTFVTRGNKIGVFKNGRDGLEFVTNVESSDIMDPSKILLRSADSKLSILSNDPNSSKLSTMDLNTGQIVSSWESSSDDPAAKPLFRNIASSSKYAQKTDDQTLLATNNNSVYSLDMRTNSVAQEKIYKTKGMQFTSMATTEDGRVVVGDADGEIRMFNDVSKNAKTTLPGLGDLTRGLDVTADGKWLLVTCPSYLLVIPTEHGDTTGFTKAIPKDQRRPPLKLQLLPKDIAKHKIKNISFTPAKFNTGENIDEEWIVTSTGKFVITWNFRKVKQNNLSVYKIKESFGTVVADQFRYSMEDQVVVALKDDVYLETRKF